MLKDPLHGNGRSEHATIGRKDGRMWSHELPELSYRDLVERVPAVLYVDASDGSSSAVYMSPQSEALLGYSRGEWLEDPGLWVKVLHPDDKERVLDAHDRARSAGAPFAEEYRLTARDGSVVCVRDEAAPVGDGSGKRAGVLLNITDRKRYEEELRKSEERFRLVAGATGEAIWDNDLISGVQEWDGATEALFGYPPRSDGTDEWWEERLHPEDRERVLCGLSDALEGGEELWEEEYRFRRADGTYAYVLDRARLVRDGYGRPVRMVGAMADVTERKLHQEELRRSEELFRRTFEAAGVGMAHVAPDGRWLRINDKLCAMSGYTREELLDMTYIDLTLPEEVVADQERVRKLLAGEAGPYTAERRYVRKDGSMTWVSLSVSLALASAGERRFFVCVAEDITRRKVSELGITARQTEILRRIAMGRKNGQIARDLSISLGTTKREVRWVLAKLGVSNRREAAARATEIGLASTSRD